MLGTLAALCLAQNVTPSQISTESRFELAAPLVLPAVYIHHQLAKHGIAQSTAHRLDLQARILWVDATANLGRVNSEEKIAELCKKVAETGFNTIVFDIKPINGYTMYPSKLTDQITAWRKDTMPAGFDPLIHMVEEAHKNKLSLFVSLNAFSEGHSYGKRDFGKTDNQFFKPGWGYDHPELQTTRYIPIPTYNNITISPTLDANPDSHPLAIYTDPEKAPNNAIYITLDANGIVGEVTYTKPQNLNGLAMLTSSTVAGIDALQDLAPGNKITISSTPTFQPSGTAQNQIPLMMNPHNEVIQKRTYAFIDEVASNYKIDGLLYDDRLRFGGLDSDFSSSTRTLFEKAINQKVQNWPDDIYSYSYTPSLTPRLQPGRLYDAWLAFRSQTLTNWVIQARKHLKSKRPNALFGIYAGSWYGDYQKYGNNYASPDLNAGFPFITPGYKKTGFANQLDLLITGCYYPNGTVFEAIQTGSAPGRTVEAGGILTNRVARDQSWSVAGIMIADFFSNPEKIQPALQAATATTQGVMVFDLSHNIEDFWPTFAQAFKTKKLAPYQVPGLLDKVRAQRADFDKRGFKEPPFPIFEGAPGTGF
ncbi:MAG: alpha amylase family protein [Fimbriimonadaceae bacterium]